MGHSFRRGLCDWPWRAVSGRNSLCSTETGSAWRRSRTMRRRSGGIGFGAALVTLPGLSTTIRNTGLSGARGWAVGVGSLGAASCKAAARLSSALQQLLPSKAAACELVLLPQIARLQHSIPASETDRFRERELSDASEQFLLLVDARRVAMTLAITKDPSTLPSVV